ncbi:MAG: lysophospholipid acyltransferase family protein, partial [Candidatus Omnitrophica bacterium]|nr:lysophospholipid acyltransferase family protein [Candidatus Omnitrophota bacterium]
LWGGWPTRNEVEGADSVFFETAPLTNWAEMIRKSCYLLEYIVFRFLAFLLRLIPLKASYRIADALGIFAVRFLGIRRETMMKNLRLAFGNEKTEAELLRIAEQSIQNLSKLVFEFLRTPEASAYPERYIEPPDVTPLMEAVKQKGGFVAIVSHFGNWEWLAIPIKKDGLHVHAVGRPLKNPYLYRYIREMREAANLTNIEKSGAVRSSIEVLKKHGILAVLIDQHESQGSVWVDFFGRKAATSTLPAMLALKYEYPVLPAFFYRDESGCSKIKYGPLFPLIRTGDLQADLLTNTQQYVTKIEEEIRKRPGDWLWAHRRWRVPPE